MKFNTRILLKINENPGISTPLLLTWISVDYKSKASARSALSRALRMMNALGLINEKKKIFFITEKGNRELQMQMKLKLIINLNELIGSQNSFREIEKIVSGLAVMNQKIKHDNSFKETVIDNSHFFLTDLRKIETKLEKEIKHLKYLRNVFGNQIGELERSGFKDIIVLKADKKNLDNLFKLCKKEVLIISQDQILLKKLGKKTGEKIKQSQAVIGKNNLKGVSREIEAHSRKKTELYFDNLKAIVVGKSLIIQCPFDLIDKLK